MADMYAWSPIPTEKGLIKRGSKVSKSDLGVDDENWQALIAAGSIRAKKCPAPADFAGSPIDWLQQQLKEAREGAESSIAEAEAEIDLSAIAASAPEPAISGAKDK